MMEDFLMWPWKRPLPEFAKYDKFAQDKQEHGCGKLQMRQLLPFPLLPAPP